MPRTTSLATAVQRERDQDLNKLFSDILELQRERVLELRRQRQQLAVDVAWGFVVDPAAILDRLEALGWDVAELSQAVQSARLGGMKRD